MKEREPRAKKAASDDSGLVQELEKAKDLSKRLSDEIKTLDWDSAKEEHLRDKKEGAGKTVRELLEKNDAMKGRLASFDFNYQNPSRDFDRTKVKGLIATLITIQPENYVYSKALEVCAGGRLYNVSESQRDLWLHVKYSGADRARRSLSRTRKSAHSSWRTANLQSESP